MEPAEMLACEDFGCEERWFGVKRPGELGERVILESLARGFVHPNALSKKASMVP